MDLIISSELILFVLHCSFFLALSITGSCNRNVKIKLYACSQPDIIKNIKLGDVFVGARMLYKLECYSWKGKHRRCSYLTTTRESQLYRINKPWTMEEIKLLSFYKYKEFLDILKVTQIFSWFDFLLNTPFSLENVSFHWMYLILVWLCTFHLDSIFLSNVPFYVSWLQFPLQCIKCTFFMCLSVEYTLICMHTPLDFCCCWMYLPLEFTGLLNVPCSCSYISVVHESRQGINFLCRRLLYVSTITRYIEGIQGFFSC